MIQVFALTLYDGDLLIMYCTTVCMDINLTVPPRCPPRAAYSGPDLPGSVTPTSRLSAPCGEAARLETCSESESGRGAAAMFSR